MIDVWLASIDHADMADCVTAAAYMFAASFSARAARQARLRCETRETMFWRSTAVLLVLLGINELLDLQTLLIEIGRANAEAYGWYGVHRKVQYVFVIALIVAAVLAGAALLWVTRRTHRAVRLAIAGLAFIGLFVLLRAASFHHLDDLLGRGIASFTWRSFEETVGIVIVAAAALLYTREREECTRRRSDSPHPLPLPDRLDRPEQHDDVERQVVADDP